MNTKRPVNLDLTKIDFPLTAILSILHRVSGVIIFLCLPFMLYLLYEAYASRTFANLFVLMLHRGVRIEVWFMLSAVFFHGIAGMRHLMMDLGYFESMRAGKITAIMSLVLSFIIIVLLGFWIW